MFDKKTKDFAIAQLGLSDDFELRYQSVVVPFIFDTEKLANLISNRDLDENEEDLTTLEIIEEEQSFIDLPAGWRLVGMYSPETQDTKYALVDFSELGAA